MLSPKILSVVLLSGLYGCGDTGIGPRGIDHEDKDEDEEYSYEYSVNGCSTGKQSFDSKGAYCAALLDEGRNKSCAMELRHKDHATNCK